MVGWLRWHCLPDTGFEIRYTLPLGHGGSPQYWLSHVNGEETFSCFFQTAAIKNRPPNSGVKGSGANHSLGPPPRSRLTNTVFKYNHIHQVSGATERQRELQFGQWLDVGTNLPDFGWGLYERQKKDTNIRSNLIIHWGLSVTYR